jgi:nicotinate-nucleotide adenylyltransferase
MPMPLPAEPGARRPIGILGGTFDPVHYGHLRLAEEGREALQLDSVIWIPAGQPPHRGTPRSSGAHRLAMVRLAIADNAAFSVDASEVEADTPSYTAVTLERLRARFGAERPLVLLLGVDAFLGLATWHRWRELFSLAHFGIANRPGFRLQQSDLPEPLASELRQRWCESADALRGCAAGGIAPFDMTLLGIAATRIRLGLENGRSCRYLLPDCVREYIDSNRLYRP